MPHNKDNIDLNNLSIEEINELYSDILEAPEDFQNPLIAAYPKTGARGGYYSCGQKV